MCFGDHELSGQNVNVYINNIILCYIKRRRERERERERKGENDDERKGKRILEDS